MPRSSPSPPRRSRLHPLSGTAATEEPKETRDRPSRERTGHPLRPLCCRSRFAALRSFGFTVAGRSVRSLPPRGPTHTVRRLCSARKRKEVVDLATLRLARMYVAMFKKSPLCEPPYRVPCPHGSAESLFHRTCLSCASLASSCATASLTAAPHSDANLHVLRKALLERSDPVLPECSEQDLWSKIVAANSKLARVR